MHSFRISSEYINDGFQAVQAKPENTEAVMSLLVETAEWLQSQGSSQWNALLKGEDSHDTAGAIRRGDVFVFKKGDEIAGMVILMVQPSPWIFISGVQKLTRRMEQYICIGWRSEENMPRAVWDDPFCNGPATAYSLKANIRSAWTVEQTMRR